MKLPKILSILFLAFLVSPLFASSPLVVSSEDTGISQSSPIQTTVPAEAPAISPPSILVYTEFADLTPGEELDNTMTAIDNTFGTNYAYSNLTDYADLDTELPGKDILLIPEQENANITEMKNVGMTWASTLTDFVNNGGVVILLDFGNESAPGLGLHIYNESDLMQFGPVLGQYPGPAITEMHRHTFGDALSRRIEYRWTPRNNTFAVATTDGVIAIDDYDTGNPIGV
ncbi:MAG: hypothetical protein ACXABY_04115, partial [Candidatus Thorarchaeota archaeon]